MKWFHFNSFFKNGFVAIKKKGIWKDPEVGDTEGISSPWLSMPCFSLVSDRPIETAGTRTANALPREVASTQAHVENGLGAILN